MSSLQESRFQAVARWLTSNGFGCGSPLWVVSALIRYTGSRDLGLTFVSGMSHIFSHCQKTTALTLLLFGGFGIAAECENLFVPFTAGETALDSSQRQVLEKLRSQKSHEVLALVKINEDAVGQPSVNFNLTADRQFQASHLTVELRPDQPGRLTWRGELDGGAGSVMFTEREQNLTGTISTKAAVYQVRPLGSGLHAIVRLNPAGFPPEHPGDD